MIKSARLRRYILRNAIREFLSGIAIKFALKVCNFDEIGCLLLEKIESGLDGETTLIEAAHGTVDMCYCEGVYEREDEDG